MAFENYTVNQYINCCYKKDYSEKGIPQEEWDIVQNEYIEASGLYEKEEFEKVATIVFLTGKKNTIEIGISLQMSFLNQFGFPCAKFFPLFKKYGHTLFWNNDKDKFLEQLEKIIGRERKNTSQLEIKIKELHDMRKKKQKKEYTLQQSRTAFMKTLNSLGKCGFVIRKDETTVEELALMIFQQNEENEEYESRSKNKR